MLELLLWAPGAVALVGWLLLAQRPARGTLKRFRVGTWCGTCGKDAAVVIWNDCWRCRLWWRRQFRADPPELCWRCREANKRVAGPCCEPRESL